MDETELGETQLADETVTARGRREPSPSRLRRGDPLGRYVVIDILGAGGMGVVYSAYDPDLGRAVAIKLLHPGPRGAANDSMGRSRLLREAQALAQLQHPNVITVHDVGEHDGQVFVAMEHIQGLTLRKWLDDGHRSWREVLEVMLAASRGLHAAHAKGMVHRDFKPDNVMLATDTTGAIERVLVMDFGLATPVDATHSAPAEITASAESLLSGPNELESLTRTGAVMGTPAYMAPEQHGGLPTDARTDQFAFCVTLYEALYGKRPFAGDTVFAVASACTKGEIEPPPRGTKVPRQLFEIVARGLAADPDRRWPSMLELQQALGRDPTRARRWAMVAASGLAVAGLVYGASVVGEQRRRAECRDAADAIDEVWNAETRERARASVLGTELSYAPSTWERLEVLLDHRAEGWRALRYETCVDPRVPEDLVDLQVECLEASRTTLKGELEHLSRASRATVNAAIPAVRLEGRMVPCLEPQLLRQRRRLPDDPDARAKVAQLHQELRHTHLLKMSGLFDESLELTESIIDEARLLDDQHLLARATLARADMLWALGDNDRAERVYEDAFFLARSLDDDATAARVAARAAAFVGHQLARTKDGRRWARHAELLTDKAELDAVAVAYHTHLIGLVELSGGELETAREHFQEALAVYERELGPASMRAMESLAMLGIIQDRLGNADEAITTFEQLLEWRRQTYGDDHPETGDAHNDLAAALMADDRLEIAEKHLLQAIEIYERADLPAQLGASLSNLVYAQRELEKIDEARITAERAVRIRRETLPEGHPAIADALVNRGQLLSHLGEHEEAIANVEQALEIYEETYEPGHHRLGDGNNILAMSLRRAGRRDQAAARFRRALDVYRSASIPDAHPFVVEAAFGLADAASHAEQWQEVLETCRPYAEAAVGGKAETSNDRMLRGGLWALVAEALLETGDAEGALVWAERALPELEVEEPDAELLHAHTEAVLGRARWEAGKDRAKAVALVREALPGLREEHPYSARWLEVTRGWLEEHEVEEE